MNVFSQTQQCFGIIWCYIPFEALTIGINVSTTFLNYLLFRTNKISYVNL